MSHFVYALMHPVTGDVRYIGISINPAIRFMQHLKSRGDRKAEWIGELRGQGLLPMMKILEIAKDEPTALQRESYWIKHHENYGVDLLNVAGSKRVVCSIKEDIPVGEEPLIRSVDDLESWKQDQARFRAEVSELEDEISVERINEIEEGMKKDHVLYHYIFHDMDVDKDDDETLRELQALRTRYPAN